MTPTLQELFANVDTLQPTMVDTWKLLVDRDCGSRNKAGVDAVGRDVEAILTAMGFKVKFYEYEKAGNLLVAEYGDCSQPFVALIGHLDTVFPDGTAAERAFTIEGDKVTGPGCLDMKGGVTVALSAMKVLSDAGWHGRPVKLLLAGDEENGHAMSTAEADMKAEAAGALYALNFETAYPDNHLVVERKGVGTFRFEVTGIGCHVGNAPREGRSAINELAAKIAPIAAMTNWEKGTTVNVGVFQGGTVPNACAEKAFCVVDVRYQFPEELERVEKGFQAIADMVMIEGTKTTVVKQFQFPCMVRLESTMALLDRANELAVPLGFPKMGSRLTGGGSDSAVTTSLGIPTLCALGVRGQFNHTVREYAELSSLAERTKLLITLLTGL